MLGTPRLPRCTGEQVLGEGGAAGLIEPCALAGQHPVAIGLARLTGVDARDLEVIESPGEGVGQMRGGGDGGGQVHIVTTAGQFHRDSGSDGGLADTALAHAHHQSVSIGLDLVDQIRQRCVGDRGEVRIGAIGTRAVVMSKRVLKASSPTMFTGLSATRSVGNVAIAGGNRGQRRLFTSMHGGGQGVGCRRPVQAVRR